MACVKRMVSRTSYSVLCHLSRGLTPRATTVPNALIKSQVINAYFSFMHQKRYCHQKRQKPDFTNDPEIKSLLAEIESDFESARGPQVADDEAVTDDNVTEGVSDDVKHESESKNQSNNNELNFANPKVVSTEPPWTSPIGLQRGKEGVFDLDELLTLLEKENGRDIVVIDIPEEARFGNHMVLVSAISTRHLKSMSSHIKWIHKQRKGVHDELLRVEGFETAPDWHAMDLGNIILHIFMPETREHYDIETLWTNWGKPVEDQSDVDPYEISPSDEFWKSLEPQTDDSDEKKKS